MDRSSLSVNRPASDGACSTSTAAAVTSKGHTTTYYVNDRVRSATQDGRTVTTELDALLRPRVRRETNGQPETIYYGGPEDEPIASEQGNDRTRYVDGVGGDLAAIVRQAGTSAKTARIQLTHLHGDVVGEAQATAAATGPTASWETDEFGVPRTPVRPTSIAQRGEASTAVNSTPAADLTIVRPAGVDPGDLLIAAVAGDGQSITAPAGWSAVPIGASQTVTSGSGQYRVFWRIADATEPASYTFDTYINTGRHRGGIVALSGVDTANPINAYFWKTGAAGTQPVAPSVKPTVDDAALLTFVGSDAGDADGGGAWAFPAADSEAWDIASGVSGSDRNHATGFRVLVNGKTVDTGERPLTDQTGLPAAPWAAITLAVKPSPRSTEQFRYRYLGAKQRPMDLPSGVIAMGARVYVPQLGRFLQTDPITGGSCNAYDYACADGVNNVDLDGAKCDGRAQCGHNQRPRGCLPGRCAGKRKCGLYCRLAKCGLGIAIGRLGGKQKARALLVSCLTGAAGIP